MSELQKIKIKGNEAVRKLRKNKFLSNQPFMIYSRELPKNQVYLEYADGTMQLVEMTVGIQDFRFVRNLTTNESSLLLQRFNLL